MQQAGTPKPWTLFATFVLVVSSAAAAAERKLVDGIAAQVGTDIVLVSEVMQVTGPIEERMRAAGAPEKEIATLRADMLDRLIERRLIEQMVRRAELQATDAEVDAAIASIASENGLSLDQLRRSVESHELTFDAYREKIRGEIQRTKILNGMVRSRVRVEEKDVRALYDRRYASQPAGGTEVHLRHLLLTYGEEAGRSEADACGQVEAARERIAGGEEFANVAAEISEANPHLGGDVGWVHLDSLAAWMAPTVRSLAPGETSDVIHMPFGCNLLHLEERREFQRKSYEEARNELYNEVFDQAVEEEYEHWIEQLRAQTYIDRKGLFAEAARLGGGPPVGSGNGRP